MPASAELGFLPDLGLEENSSSMSTCRYGHVGNPIVKRLAVRLFLITALFLSLGSSLPTAMAQDVGDLAMRARINLYDSWDFDSVAYYFDRIIGQEHTPAFAYSDYGWYLLLLNRLEEGLEFIERAAKMAPSDKQLIAWNAWAQLWNGNLEQAEEWIERSLALDPTYGEGLFISSMVASEVGDHGKAVRLAGQAARQDPDWRGALPLALAKGGRRDEALGKARQFAGEGRMMDTMLLMEAFGLLGADDEALTQLERGFELRHPFMPWIEYIPNIGHLRQTPRYVAVLEKMDLPE